MMDTESDGNLARTPASGPTRRGVLAALSVGGLVSACAAVPGDGPTLPGGEAADPAPVEYRLVVLDKSNVGAFTASSPGSGPDFPRRGVGPLSRVIAPGDVLKIVLYELKEGGGLFAPPSAGGTAFPAVVVSGEGTITLPYVGALRAAGTTPESLRARIVDRLTSRAVEPEAYVEIVQQRQNFVTVTGSVKAPGRLPLNGEIVTVLDAVAKAGAPTEEALHYRVVVRRGGRVVMRLQLDDLMNGGDRPVERNDDILVEENRQFVTVLGAVAKTGRIDMPRRAASLMDILGKVGGLEDSRARRAGVFVYRRDGRLPAGLSTDRVSNPVPVNTQMPVVFQLDFGRDDGPFIAQHFVVRPDDVVFVTNAPVHEWGKIVRAFLSTVTPAVTIGRAASAL